MGVPKCQICCTSRLFQCTHISRLSIPAQCLTLHPVPFHPAPSLLKEVNKKLSYRRWNALSVIKQTKATVNEHKMLSLKSTGAGCCAQFYLFVPVWQVCVLLTHFGSRFYVTRGRGWRNPWGSTDLSRGSFRLVRDFPRDVSVKFRGSRGRLGEVVDVSGKSRTSLRQVRDFPETSPTCLGEVSGKSRTSRGSLGEVRVMEFGLQQLCPSVRPSVRHIPVFYQNSTYRRSFFTTRQPDHSTFITSTIFLKFRRGHSLRVR